MVSCPRVLRGKDVCLQRLLSCPIHLLPWRVTLPLLCQRLHLPLLKAVLPPTPIPARSNRFSAYAFLLISLSLDGKLVTTRRLSVISTHLICGCSVPMTCSCLPCCIVYPSFGCCPAVHDLYPDDLEGPKESVPDASEVAL